MVIRALENFLLNSSKNFDIGSVNLLLVVCTQTVSIDSSQSSISKHVVSLCEVSYHQVIRNIRSCSKGEKVATRGPIIPYIQSIHPIHPVELNGGSLEEINEKPVTIAV